jgi:N-dimethylarginine dimethylaminohydrolase
MPVKFSQYNETDTLKSVIIGRWEGYRRVAGYTELVNADQREGLPYVHQLKPEFEAFRQVLENYGIEVLIPGYVGKFVYDQLTPRDIAVVINDKLVLCNMVKKSRRYEAAGIFPLIPNFSGDEPDVLIPPSGCLLEGGDIMVDKGRILVGISQRTNEAGYRWLQKVFGDQLEIVPVYTKKPEDDVQVLHLDCTFNPVGRHHALIYVEGFTRVPDCLKTDYQWIRISKEEQRALATNVLSLSEDVVIARDHPLCKRVNRVMQDNGISVEEIIFDGAPSTGGSLRCCSLPLVRNIQTRAFHK